MKAFATQRPVAGFILLTFGLSYGLGLPFQWSLNAWAPGLPEFAALYVGRTPVVLGPALAALFVAHASSGRAGVRALLDGLRPRSRQWAWWPVAVAVPLAVTTAGYAAGGGALDEIGRAVAGGWPLLLAHYALQVGLVGIGEELGWRGWLLPRLLASQSRGAATLLVAAVWTLWHLPILLSGVETALSFAAAAFGLSVLFTALWWRAGRSTFAVALAHGSVNAPLVFFEGEIGGDPAHAVWLAACALYALLAVGTVVLSWRWWLAKPVPAAAPA